MSLRLIARSFANTQMRLVLPATSATARVATRHISFFGGKEEGKAPADGAQPAAAAAPGQPEPTEQEKLISKQAEEIASLTDKYKRSLAEAENARRRADLEVQNAKEFAIQKFAKDMVSIADVLQMALAATPDEAKKSDKHPEFVSLLQGVEGTFNLMNQVFARNGLESFNPVGLKFDANKHEALVQVPDPSKESGTIAFVQKSGYLLKGRVLRAACVGVVKN
eukprot:m.70363 g.70363  ORF g.70363 m.70363 type:complete len:223 (+) comp50130_c0_seq8:167-835(+)